MLIAAQLLLTVLTLGYSAIPAFADFNPTHATNPTWTGHARFHCVWQVSSYILIGVISLVLIWSSILPGHVGLILALGIAISIYAGFFTAVFARNSYGGRLYDENGYLPLNGPLGLKVDVNISIFTTMAALVAVTLVILAGLV